MATLEAYKGYTATTEYDADDDVFHGRVDGIRDVVTFEAKTEGELPAAFHGSLDDYFGYCAENGRDPEKPC